MKGAVPFFCLNKEIIIYIFDPNKFIRDTLFFEYAKDLCIFVIKVEKIWYKQLVSGERPRKSTELQPEPS